MRSTPANPPPPFFEKLPPDILNRVEQVEIPDSLNVIASYPIAVINDSEHRELADDFIAFVLSDDGQTILTKSGFISIYASSDE